MQFFIWFQNVGVSFEITINDAICIISPWKI